MRPADTLRHQLDVIVIVPTCRPGNVETVRGNFLRQQYQQKRLLVVENGGAIGHYSRISDITLISEANQSSARNAALDYIQSVHPSSYVVNMDDDDYYGQWYIDEHVELASRGTVNVKPTAWCHMDHGLYFFGHHWEPYAVNVESCVGGTIGHFAKECSRYPVVPAGEERGFLDGCRDIGLVVKNSSHANFVYNRTGDPMLHTYRAGFRQFLKHMGNSAVKVDSDVWSVIDYSVHGPAERLPRR